MPNICINIIILFLIIGQSCKVTKHEEDSVVMVKHEEKKKEISIRKKTEIYIQKNLPELEQILIESGLVKIRDYDSSIQMDLKYACENNFLKMNLYGDLKEGYLQEPVAKQLVKAQRFLKDTFPQYSLVVFDAVRPLSIQQMMWDSIKVSVDQRSHFLSNPSFGSLHNFGAAVDVSIVDADGKELDMGTAYDSFEPLAYPALENSFVNKGLLTKQQLENRMLLRRVMRKSLFKEIPTEWWHFNACSNKEARVYYSLIRNHTLKRKTRTHLDRDGKVNICFKVQIKVSMSQIELNSPEFKGLQVTSYKHKGLYKYVIGDCKDIASVYDLLDRVNKLGFSDAFIVAFNNNSRIEVRDAIELMP